MRLKQSKLLLWDHMKCPQFHNSRVSAKRRELTVCMYSLQRGGLWGYPVTVSKLMTGVEDTILSMGGGGVLPYIGYI